MSAREQIKSYVTPDEKAEVTALAKQARLTTSELVRRLVLGQKLPDTNRHLSVIELVKINADQARLGNLLRMAVMEEEFELPEGLDLDTLFDTIRETQSILKAKIKEL